MEKLKAKSLRVYPGMIVHWPQSDADETLDMTETALKFPGCFSANNSTVCFIDNQGKVFVAPYTRRAYQALHGAGFKDCGSNFYVPFSNGDVPKREKFYWEHLRLEARKSYEEDFVSDCGRWCDEHNIGEISKESLSACFCMPPEGVPVKSKGFENRYYPACNQSCMDCTVVDRLGKYCTNNGRCIFIYRDGKTYVANGYWILDELQAAGFTQSSIFVPFSNGEEITDLRLKAQWEATPKK